MKTGIVNFIVERPWRALALGLLFFFVCAGGGQHLMPDFTYRVWFNEEDPLLQEFDAFERKFGNDDRAIVIVHSPSGIFDEDSAKLLQELTEKSWLLPHVIRVDSLTNFNWVHAEEDDLLVEPLIPDDLELTAELLAERKDVALSHETLPDYLVSRDGTAALVYITVKPALGGSPDYEGFLTGIIDENGKQRDGLRKLAGEMKRGDHTIYMTGAPTLNHSFKEAAQKDISTILPLVFLLTLVFLGILFRRVSGVLLPIVVIAPSVVAAMGIGGWLGYSINNMTSIVPQILVAIAIADSVHILVSFFRALDKGANRKTGAIYSLEKNFLPTVLTSVSTAIGFFSFSQADVVPIGQLGVMAGLGTLFAWVFTYFVLGPLMVLTPIRSGTLNSDEVDLHSASGRAIRLTNLLHARRKPILAVFGVITLVTGVLAAQTVVNSDPFMYFPKDSPINVATDFLEDKVGGAVTLEVILNSGKDEGFKDPEFMKKAEVFQSWLEEQPHVTSNNSLVDVLKSMNRSLHEDQQEHYVLPESREAIAQQYLLYTMSLPQGMDLNDRVSVKNDSIRVTSAWNIHDSATVIEKIDEVTARGKELGLDVVVTGKGQLWQRMNPYVVKTFVTSLSAAVILMSLLMVGVFRSFFLGMLAMLPNLFPLILGAAVIRAIGQDLDMGAILAFSFCLGIAVDDTVHFMANYARLTREGQSSREAIASIFTHTAPALFITTVILVVAFGAFLFASFLPNKNFGLFVSVILSMALITDLSLLPALLLGGKDEKNMQQAD